MKRELNGGSAELRLPESPYTYVRTRVMRTLLIPRSEYEKLLKMSLAEISNYLGETQYRQEITELGVSYKGIELVEQALRTNFVRTIEKLKRISPPEYNEVIDAYLLRYDVENLKTVLRAQQAGLTVEELRALLLPVGQFSLEELERFAGMERQELLRLLTPRFGKLEGSLGEIETALDHTLYRSLLSFAERLPKQGALFRRFIEEMVETRDLLTLFRLRREGFKQETIRRHLFTESVLLKRLLSAKDDEALAALLTPSPFREIAPLVSEASLIPLEIALMKRLYRRALLFERQNPLSVYVILSFLFAKETEVDNLRKIIKAKHLNIPVEVVAEQLVTTP